MPFATNGGRRHAGGVAPFPIRSRTDADLPAVADLLLATHHHDGYPVVAPPDFVAWGGAQDVIDSWVAVVPSEPGAMTPPGGCAGDVVGHVVLTSVPHADAATPQWTDATGLSADQLAAVRRLVVAHHVRGTGTGLALLDAAVHAAHSLGRRPVLDMADSLNAAAGLYAGAGFERVGAYGLDLEGAHFRILTFVGPEPPPT